MLGDKSRNRKNKTGGINVENKKRVYFIGGLAVAVVVAVILWFICAGRSTVHDLRNGSDAIRTELDDARTAQQRQANTLGQAVEAAERGSRAIENSEQANQEISRIERTDAELIRESKSILERVRARGGTESKD